MNLFGNTPMRLHFLLTILTMFVLGTQLPNVHGQDVQAKNASLLSATSPFEDLAEYAMAKNEVKIPKAVASVDKHCAVVQHLLTPQTASSLAELVANIHVSAKTKDYHSVATDSVEAYRLLVNELDAESLVVPREVSLLDYAGFQLHTLLADANPNWNSINETISDADEWWNATKPKVTNKGLRDAMNSTLRGLIKAADTKNLAMLDFAAQIDLDLVDLLEAFFEKQSPK